jgi:trans-aconitate methyltransferase
VIERLPFARLVAVDLSASMLAVARSRVPAHWAAFIQADFRWAG